MLILRSFNRFLLIGLALLGISVTSAKATIFSAIDDLNINGTLYDVTFHPGSSFIELWDANGDFDFSDGGTLGPGGPTFWDDEPGATAAAAAIMSFLGDEHETAGFQGDGFVVPFGIFVVGAVVTDFVLVAWDNDSAVGVDTLISGSGFFNDDVLTGNPYASFTTSSAVPVPAAVWLFGTALVGFIGMSRRRKVA